MATRRRFLQTSALTVGVLGTAPAWLLRAAAQGTHGGKTLVVIFQRGAADGLNIVAPFAERRYYDLRPSLAVAAPTSTNTTITDLDGRFALHPSLQPLKPLWEEGQLAFVHAAGSPDSSRSHFQAQELMESGTAVAKASDGWLNRALPASTTNASPLRAVAVGAQVPQTLRGDRPAVAVEDLSRFQVGDATAAAMLERLYGTAADSRLKTQGAGAFEALRRIDALRQQRYAPANGAQYSGEFGRRLQQIAQLIKGDVGVEAAFVDYGDWDHHVNEAGALANVLREFGAGLVAFARDMGQRMADIVVVTMSEFGRTAAENGTGGTDHGHGGVMMVLGGPVRGKQVLGTWPGLEPEQLFEGRDLAVTTDYRDVLGELVRGHLGQDPGPVFRDFTVQGVPGLLRT